MDTQVSLQSLSISGNSAYPLIPSIPRGAWSKCGCLVVRRILYFASADNMLCREDTVSARARTARLTSQVCKLWREAALSVPEIWLGCVLNWSSHPKWLDIVLQRSSPLTLDVIIPSSAPQESINLALKHLPRIRNLDVYFYSHGAWAGAEKLICQQEAPRLEWCSIKVAQTFNLPRRTMNLFNGFAPKLWYFQTRDCCFNLAMKIFRGLKVLSIHNTPLNPSSLDHLFDVLQNITGLEELDISSPIKDLIAPQYRSQPFLTPDPLRLPRLKKLTVSAAQASCAQLLRGLSFPQSCDIALLCRNACYDLDLRDILERLASALSLDGIDPSDVQQTVSIGAAHISFAMEGPRDRLNCQSTISLNATWSPQNPYLPTEFIELFHPIAQVFQYRTNHPATLCLFSEFWNAYPAADVSPTIRRLLLPWLSQVPAAEVKLDCGAFDLCLDLLLAGRSNPVALPNLQSLLIEGVDFQIKNYARCLLSVLEWRTSVIFFIGFSNCRGGVTRCIPDSYAGDIEIDDEFIDTDDNESISFDSDSDSDSDSDCTVHGNSD